MVKHHSTSTQWSSYNGSGICTRCDPHQARTPNNGLSTYLQQMKNKCPNLDAHRILFANRGRTIEAITMKPTPPSLLHPTTKRPVKPTEPPERNLDNPNSPTNTKPLALNKQQPKRPSLLQQHDRTPRYRHSIIMATQWPHHPAPRGLSTSSSTIESTEC